MELGGMRDIFFSSLRAFYHLTNFEFYPNNLADRVSVCWLVAGPGLGPRNWREPNKGGRRQRGENRREHIGSTELQTAHCTTHSTTETFTIIIILILV